MESKKLAALLASLLSQLILLIQLLFPTNSTPLSLLSSSESPSLSTTTFSLIHHFLSSSSLLLLPNKRLRLTEPEPEREPGYRGRHGLTRSPDSFKASFKMSASTFEWLSGLLEPLLDCRDPIGSPLNLTTELRLGVGLFRLASGCEFAEIAKQFGVSEPAARFCAKQLCRVLCTNFRFWVGFPSQNEILTVSKEFECLTGLPNCCGFIGCTRFSVFRSGKGCGEKSSVAAQIVVDSSSRILSVVAGFSGGKSDWSVLKSSSLYKDVEDGRLLSLSGPVGVDGVAVNPYFVGDGGYPLLPWLMMPFSDAMLGSREKDFNKTVGLMRGSLGRTVSSLRNWGVISKLMHEDLRTAVAYIGACSILHNALLMREDFSAFSEDVGDYSAPQCSQEEKLEDNLAGRKAAVIRSALATRAKK